MPPPAPIGDELVAEWPLLLSDDGSSVVGAAVLLGSPPPTMRGDPRRRRFAGIEVQSMAVRWATGLRVRSRHRRPVPRLVELHVVGTGTWTIATTP